MLFLKLLKLNRFLIFNLIFLFLRSMMIELLACLSLIGLFMLITYLYAMRYKDQYDSKHSHSVAQNVLLVIAHPDDETV